MVLNDSDSDLGCNQSEEDENTFERKDVKNGDFVLVKYASKYASKISYFIVKVLGIKKEDGEDVFQMKYLTRVQTKTKTLQFVFPDKDDKDGIIFDDIFMKLPFPKTVGRNKAYI